jgi:hypothetical protein
MGRGHCVGTTRLSGIIGLLLDPGEWGTWNGFENLRRPVCQSAAVTTCPKKPTTAAKQIVVALQSK